MGDLLTAPPEPKAKKKKQKKKKSGASGSAKSHGINVHVNVVNQAGDGQKKPVNAADDALSRLRGY